MDDLGPFAGKVIVLLVFAALAVLTRWAGRRRGYFTGWSEEKQHRARGIALAAIFVGLAGVSAPRAWRPPSRSFAAWVGVGLLVAVPLLAAMFPFDRWIRGLPPETARRLMTGRLPVKGDPARRPYLMIGVGLVALLGACFWVGFSLVGV